MSVAAPDRTCSQPGCPFPGRCLEGFDDVTACPYTGSVEGDRENSAAETDALEAGTEDAGTGHFRAAAEPSDESGSEVVLGRAGVVAPPQRLVDVVGGEALTMDEARPILGRERCQVVLVAGDAKAGKTTLVVEFYARFLIGPFNGWSFAGSVTLRALDLRHFTAQAASGGSRPYTGRTQDEDMRLLHLRLARADEYRHLLFSDVRGEFFDDVVEGAPVSENVQIAPRTDRCIVAIDGERVASARTAETAFLRAQCLIGGLLADGGLDVGVPIAIVCTKWDQVPQERREAALRQAEEVAAFARQDGRPVHVQCLSVRPGPPVSDLVGLSELLDWLVAPVRPPASSLRVSLPTGRQFWGEGGAR